MVVRRFISFVLAILFYWVPFSASALDDSNFTAILDLRFAHTGTAVSWLEEGLGKARYGSGEDLASRNLFRVGEAALVFDVDFTSSIAGHLHLKSDAEQDRLVDLAAAYVAFEPESSSNNRITARVGMFFPPFSLENTETGWKSPYSISSSAINSWIGDEIRILGGEISGLHDYSNGTVSLSAAIFGANDPAGSLLAWRGWALHDRKTGAQDHLPLAPLSSISEGGSIQMQAQFVDPIREVDNRAGYYANARLEHAESTILQLSYYDNNADETSFDGEQYAWRTWFSGIGLHHIFSNNIEFLSQFIQGGSSMGQIPVLGHVVDIDFQSAYLMLSGTWGNHRLSLRQDWFDIDDRDYTPDDNNNEDGTSSMLAYTYRISDIHAILFEAMNIKSTRPARSDLGLAADASESILQVNYRLVF